MADIPGIRDELSNDPLARGYSSMTNQEVWDDLNTRYRQRKVPIPVDRVRRYLFTRGLWLPIKRGTVDSAESARDAIQMFDQFDMSDGEVETTINNLLDALINDGFIDSGNKSDVQAMGIEELTRAEELSLLGASPEIGHAHVEQARAL